VLTHVVDEVQVACDGVMSELLGQGHDEAAGVMTQSQ